MLELSKPENKMKKIIVLGLTLSSVCIANAQNNIPEAYSVSKNLQQESIKPYSAQNRDESSPYHFREKEEHEIKFGRPVLNKNFDDPKVFYDFYKEQVYAYLKGFKKFLNLDLYEDEAYIGISERMINNRHSILLDLEYSVFRARTIHIEDEKINAKQREFLDAFQHLFNDYRDALPTFIEYYKHQNESFVNFERYNESSNDVLSGHIAESSMDLFDLLDESEAMLKEPLKPNLKLKYELQELLDLIKYRNKLHLIYREAWHKSEAFLKLVDVKEVEELQRVDIETLQSRMDDCISSSARLMLELKSLPKYKSDISYKNLVNKYVKYVQTSGKSNFKKIISVFEKNDELTDVELVKIKGIANIYKDREKEYLQNLAMALEDIKGKYTAEAKLNAKNDGFDIVKERERIKKEKQREEDRERKNYWKNRNLE